MRKVQLGIQASQIPHNAGVLEEQNQQLLARVVSEFGSKSARA